MSLMPVADLAGTLVPLVAIICIFGLPLGGALLRQLLRHQKEMAELIHRDRTDNAKQGDEISSLRAELETFKQTLLDHQMSMDQNLQGAISRIDRLEQAQRSQSING